MLTAIPPVLGDLTMLEDLDLDRYSLTGPIPPELGNLTMLKYLYLGNDGLTGPIPTGVGRWQTSGYCRHCPSNTTT